MYEGCAAGWKEEGRRRKEKAAARRMDVNDIWTFSRAYTAQLALHTTASTTYNSARLLQAGGAKDSMDQRMTFAVLAQHVPAFRRRMEGRRDSVPISI